MQEDSEYCNSQTGVYIANRDSKMLKEECRNITIKDVGVNPLQMYSSMRCKEKTSLFKKELTKGEAAAKERY